MGGFLNLINFNQSGMARKVVKHKRHGGGLEAPRNSLELPIETSQSYVAAGENEPYTHKMTEDYFGKNHFQTGASMKKLISEEISKKPNTKHSVPSIVARLMGVDMLPTDAKPMVNQFEKKNEKPRGNFQKEDWTKDGSGNHVSFDSKFSRHRKSNSFDINVDRDPDLWIGSMNSNPRHREHPQEKELQKFKKEFEAWQASRFRECSNAVEIDNIPYQWLGQENPNKEKLVLYENSRKMTTQAKPRELKSRALKASPHESPDLEYPGCRNELTAHTLETNVCKKHGRGNRVSSENRESFSSRNKVQNMNFEQSHKMTNVPKLDSSSAPSKIVILRPGPDRISYDEESWASSSGTSEERGSIEVFLEEVKERLKCELQGKAFRKGPTVRGGGIETPYRQKASDPKQIAQRIVKHVRDSVTRDIGMNLLQSEYTQSYKSEIHLNGAASPEFISRDTRIFLSEGLKNVLKGETCQNSSITLCGSSGSVILENERNRLEKSGDKLNAGNKINYWNNLKCEPDMQSRSFLRGPDDEVIPNNALSPRNLIRSLSAPVSGTSFGKLLLEDPHILTGAHIRRKHEEIEKVTLNAKKGMKEKFNFREKVSSLKYSFALNGRLFRRKIESLEESHGNRGDFMRDIMSVPTVVTSFYDPHENSTEVPPSPASVCSSAQEDLWRPVECLNPISTNDLPSLEDDAMPQVFREINSNLRELRKQLNQLETGDSEDTVNEQFFEVEMGEPEDPVEAYIRDLLVASGFYDGSSDISLSRWDPFPKPISNRVFEELEVSYRKRTKGDEEFAKDQCEKVDHKVLFDLLNEALSTVLGPPVTLSRFMRKAISSIFPPPCGRKLLKLVWEIIRVHVYPPIEMSCYSVDRMVTRDIQSAPWSQLLDDDTNSLGKEMESQIIGDLMEEIVSDMQS